MNRNSPESRAKMPLIMIAGMYGTGKTATAKAIANTFPSYERIGMDEVRQWMGITQYDPKDTPLVMNVMCDLVWRKLRMGEGVIVERPHQTYDSRRLSYDMARDLGKGAILIESTCPAEIARTRIASRPTNPNIHLPPSDSARYDAIAARWQAVERDFEIDPELGGYVSYVRYETNLPKTTRVKVCHGLRELTELICQKLDELRL